LEEVAALFGDKVAETFKEAEEHVMEGEQPHEITEGKGASAATTSHLE
jgi:hypothetical protein